MIHNRFSSFVIALTACFLVACAGGPEMSGRMGANIGPVYQTPVDYSAHRDQQQSFETTTGTLAYTDHGEGPALVLLHGVPTSSWMYRKLIPRLQDDMRVITIDHLGFGSSDKPDAEPPVYSPQAHAGRARELLASLDITEYAILMHDMGGLVAWEMLRADMDAVSQLVVLNTIVNEEGFEHPDIEPGSFTRRLIRAYTGPLTSVAILEQTFNDLGLTGRYKLSEPECFGYVAPMREGADPALYSFFTGVNDDLFVRLEENRTLFKSWDGEALVFWGGRDDVLTTGQIPILQDMLSIPDENIHLYPDNAHFLAEEIPDEIGQKVRAFRR